MANGLDGRGSNPEMDNIFPFTMSRPTLGAFKRGLISTGVTREGREALHLAPSSRMVEIHLYLFISLHWLALN
jgi:hypothetical protein